MSCILSLLVASSTTYHHVINRGHQRYSYTTFDLSPPQRQLVLLETTTLGYMVFMGGVYCGIEGWEFDDALYWCVSTLATIGFGDISPSTTLGRILLLVLAPIGIGLIGGLIFSMRQVVLELFTLQLATQFSKEFNLDKEVKAPRKQRQATLPTRPASAGNIGRQRLRRASDLGRVMGVEPASSEPGGGGGGMPILKEKRSEGNSSLAKSAPGRSDRLSQSPTSTPPDPTSTNVTFASLPQPDPSSTSYGLPFSRSQTLPSFNTQHKPLARSVTITRSDFLPSLTIVGNDLKRKEVIAATRRTFRDQIFSSLVVVGVFLCGFGAVFAWLEEWEWMEGVYFCFCALMTIAITYLGSMISERAMNQWTVERKKIARRVDRYERKAELKDYWRRSRALEVESGAESLDLEDAGRRGRGAGGEGDGGVGGEGGEVGRGSSVSTESLFSSDEEGSVEWESSGLSGGEGDGTEEFRGAGVTSSLLKLWDRRLLYPHNPHNHQQQHPPLDSTLDLH
ncbi:Potassium channel [Rhizophlyctis rosea]|nr:Potassium channel [Rhizophlyctis rosea]